MKTVVVLAALVALAVAGTVPTHYDVETKQVNAEFVEHQKKILGLFEYFGQVNYEAEWYKIGHEYDIHANIEHYTNKKAVEEFLTMWKGGLLPKYEVFSIFYEQMREEAIALFHLFYYAKDFETFYKTACWARVYLNEYQFVYTLYIAVIHRPDTQGIVVPAPYEVFPEFFTNHETLYKAYRMKQTDGFVKPEAVFPYGIVKENDYYVYYSNYSTYWNYEDEEHKLSYFTEDIGLNSYYYYFHSYMPFWMKGDYLSALKENRGEIYFHFYQQLLARFYLERLSNGLGEIPEFNWWKPIKNGYSPFLTHQYYPFIQRNEYYSIPTNKYTEELQFLDTYEKTFQQYLQRGHFKAFNQEVDFYNPKSVNFVGNYWQANMDLFEHTGPRNYYRSYEMTARHLLGAAPETFDEHTVAPYALNFYQTSLRDPMFWQLYSKIMNYILQFKEHLEPYTKEQLHYNGVKVEDVHVDKLVTYFDYYDYDITNAIYRNPEEFKAMTPRYKVRQPRLNHKPFTVTVDVKSEAETQAAVKIFLGPKYDSNGFPITFEDNWMNFVQLDWFVQKLTPGQNKIVRNSNDFFYYKEDSLPITEIYKYLEQSKVPLDMSEEYEAFPKRLMLPKGTDGGFPYQLFVAVYPYEAPAKEYEQFKFVTENKPFGYPLDRPVNEWYWKEQSNMFFEDVLIYFEGEHFPYTLNNPFYIAHNNQVPKH